MMDGDIGWMWRGRSSLACQASMHTDQNGDEGLDYHCRFEIRFLVDDPAPLALLSHAGLFIPRDKQ